ncbi:MAG TPA: cyclic nucleotide-binding domain-containing protein [candidate division Zixibacteria bacterium]|nr:cyclic nucleotide-binding domain-containing protein [candidate division Zixibacteria bacterium]
MAKGTLGKVFHDGDVIIRQGDIGDCMYVIQDGEVEVILESEGQEIPLQVHGPGSFFGEMAIFDKDVRSATVRAIGDATVLTVDKKSLMRRVHEDPSLAFKLVETMSGRIRELVDKVGALESELDSIRG